MRILAPGVLLLVLSGCLGHGRVLLLEDHFDSAPTGTSPSGFKPLIGAWSIAGRTDAPSPPNVLEQRGQSLPDAFAISSRSLPDDVTVLVASAVTGGADQREPSIVLRWHDKDNHYVFGFDAKEGGVRLTRVRSGIHDDLFLDRSRRFAVGEWVDLQVTAKGSTFTGSVGGEQVLRVRDDTFATGQVGLATKKDTTARFDDFRVFEA